MPPEHVVYLIVVVVVAITRLVAFAIDDDKRWPRFRNLALFTVFLALAVVVGWWLLAGDGVQEIIHHFGSAHA